MSARHVQAAPVVLLHSSASSGRQWHAAVDALHAAGVAEVHAVDLHGHGARAAWQGPQSLRLADEAALLEPLLQRPGGAHLVGHSYGGAVALATALRWPGQVRSVVAYEPVLFSLLKEDAAGSAAERTEVVGGAAAMGEDLCAGRPLAAAQRFVELWSGRDAWLRLPAERCHGVAARMPAVMAQFEALFDAGIGASDLARLRMPLLLMCGAHTVPITRRIAQRLRDALPRAQHETAPDMGHMGPITHAHAFNRRLVEFLAPQQRALHPEFHPTSFGVPA